MSRTKTFDNIAQAIGDTPMVRINRLIPSGQATVFAKCEFFQPLNSVKDRIGVAMIEAGERDGKIKKDTVIVEPTSGNTGIGLALVGAVRGYKVILTMPDDYSNERRRLLQRLGAQLVLTPAIEGMTGAVFAAEDMVKKNRGYFMPQQFNNPANPDVHRRTTALEILEDTGGRLDAFVAGVGTGGTITGVGEVLKKEVPGVRIIAVEPARSPVLGGGRAGLHAIQGIGASFIPGVLNREVYDELIAVRDEEAIEMTKQLTRKEGLLVGISSGCNVFAALAVAKRLGEGKRVVTMLPDTGERYLSVNM
jgi:cysteine synthase